MKIIEIFDAGDHQGSYSINPVEKDGKFVDIDTARRLRAMLDVIYRCTDAELPRIKALLEETKGLLE